MKKKEEPKLTYERVNFFAEATVDQTKNAFNYSVGYRTYLDKAKTEREAIDYAVEMLKAAGFVDVNSKKKSKKVYRVGWGKTLCAAVLGKQPVAAGVNIVGSHVDSPRVDLKQAPLYEEKPLSMTLMRTHYYGGIKKYQWFSTPLALHGTVVTADGKTVRVVIGEDDSDPVFVMPDLLPHLAKAQSGKVLREAFEAGQMNIIFTTIPAKAQKEGEEVKDGLKQAALKLLYDKYGFTEADLLSAEMELVPAGKARDCGMDASMVMGYGQDDRICAYTSLTAMMEIEPAKLDKTAVIYLSDKEEVGSAGNTGAQSVFFTDFLGDLLAWNGEATDSRTLRKCLLGSQCLSSDVNAALDPSFQQVHEAANACHLGYGICVTKYTGSGGKGGSSDASTEFMAKVIRIMESEGVNWQTGNLGKVDEGGGGTIAKFMANLGPEVIDCGPGLLGMHSLYEISSKADIYSCHQAYVAFFKKA